MQEPYLRFSCDRRSQLTSIGLSDEQILQLEYALTAVRYFATPPPSLTDVRDQIDPLLHVLRAAYEALYDFNSKRADISAAFGEVLSRSLVKTYDFTAVVAGKDSPQSSPIDEAMASLADVVTLFEEVRSELGNEMRRGNRSPLSAMNAIDNAINQTWARQNQGSPVPSVGTRVTPSSGSKSEFYRIACLCYEQLGIDSEPERPTKEYIRALSAARRKLSRDDQDHA